MSTSEPRRHVLVWVAPEFLESEGMLRILQEVGAIPGQEAEWEKIVEAAENTGGFALGGMLVESGHGAGIWISPPNDHGLEMLIPWHFVRSVLTAQQPQSSKIFGLAAELAKQPNGTHGEKGQGK
jgi:hypothetical protein